MPDESQEQLVGVITRGFANVQEQAREREGRISQLSEKMIGVEWQLAQLNKTVARIESEMSKSDTTQLGMRVAALEKANDAINAKASDNAKWIKGLIGSVVLMLLAILFNTLRIGLKQ
jgi:chromosome segregation ATPase